MNTKVKATLTGAAVSTAVIGVAAFSASAQALYSIAIDYGHMPRELAWTLPVSVDGLTIAALCAVIHAVYLALYVGHKVRAVYPHSIALLTVALSIAGNVVHRLDPATLTPAQAQVVGMAISSVPAITLALALHLGLYILKQLRVRPAVAPLQIAAAPHTVNVDKTAVSAAVNVDTEPAPAIDTPTAASTPVRRRTTKKRRAGGRAPARTVAQLAPHSAQPASSAEQIRDDAREHWIIAHKAGNDIHPTDLAARYGRQKRWAQFRIAEAKELLQDA